MPESMNITDPNDGAWDDDQTLDTEELTRSIDGMVSGNAARSRDLAGHDATANALIETLGELHHLIEDQAGQELSEIMIGHVESELEKRSIERDVIQTVRLPMPEIRHPTARLLGGDALENALILNSQGEENEALVAYTSATLTALSESLAGTPNPADVIERIRANTQENWADQPRAVTVH